MDKITKKKRTIGTDEVPLCHCISQLGAFFKTMIIAAECNTENMKVSSTLYDIVVFPSYTKLAALLFFTAPNGNKLETAK